MGGLWSGILLIVGFAQGCRDEPLPATGELSVEALHSEIVGDDYLLRLRLTLRLR